MSFEERNSLAKGMENTIIPFLKERGFTIEQTGYESFVSHRLQDTLRKIHKNDTIRFLRYLPDFFGMHNGKYFFIELKVMNTPIKYDGKIFELKRISGVEDLTKENVGVVETEAITNYQNLTKIGVKIMVVVYCTFHRNKILVDWEENIQKFYNDKVRLGEGNASFTPYTNIHLDKMKTFQGFLNSEFNLKITEEEVSQIIDKISN